MGRRHQDGTAAALVIGAAVGSMPATIGAPGEGSGAGLQTSGWGMARARWELKYSTDCQDSQARGARHKPGIKSSDAFSDQTTERVSCMSPRRHSHSPLPCLLFLLFPSILSLTDCIICLFIMLSLGKSGLNEGQQSLSILFTSEPKAVLGL